MAAAAILKNRKITISRPRFDRFRPNLARRGSSTLFSRPTVKKFEISNFQDDSGRHLEKSKTAISRPRFHRFRWNFAPRRSSVLFSRPTVKNSKFEISKMAAAAMLKILKIAIPRSCFDRLPQNLARLRIFTFRTLFMVALCNRADHYIFMLWFVLLSFFFLFFLA